MSIKGIRLPKVLEITGASRSWLYQEIAANRFPQPVLLGKRSVIWVEQEIFDYLEERVKQSRHALQTQGRK
ncbi:MAG: AlpA family phage regulatory protein [Gammaproteobacteria bacterium]|nr:AlpA family phage regulatory protein [Gammaproteobacteria bacterium]